MKALLLALLIGTDPIVSSQIERAERAVAAASLDFARDTRTREALGRAYGELGRVNHAYEQFDAAEAAYREAAKQNAGDARWPHLLGYLYQQTGRFDEAAARFAEARRLQPANRAAAIRLAQVYLALGRLREAGDEFEALRDVFPALAAHGLGEIALRESRFDLAVRHLRDALERVPQATSLHYPLAMAYRGLGRVDEARAHLERRGSGVILVGDPIVDALQTLVRGERGLVILGRRAYEAGQFREAAAAFERAVADAPGSATARFNLGLAVLQLGDAPAAIAHLTAAFAMQPEEAQHGRELARVLLRAGRKPEAAGVLARVVSVDEADEDSLVSLAILLADAARYADAIARLEASARRHPQRDATATTLARLLASVPDRALRNGARALDLAQAVHARDGAPAHAETVALALAELGRCAEAREWMQRGITAAAQRADAAEAGRLTAELRRYEGDTCRRP